MGFLEGIFLLCAFVGIVRCIDLDVKREEYLERKGRENDD